MNKLTILLSGLIGIIGLTLFALPTGSPLVQAHPPVYVTNYVYINTTNYVYTTVTNYYNFTNWFYGSIGDVRIESMTILKRMTN